MNPIFFAWLEKCSSSRLTTHKAPGGNEKKKKNHCQWDVVLTTTFWSFSMEMLLRETPAAASPACHQRNADARYQPCDLTRAGAPCQSARPMPTFQNSENLMKNLLASVAAKPPTIQPARQLSRFITRQFWGRKHKAQLQQLWHLAAMEQHQIA